MSIKKPNVEAILAVDSQMGLARQNAIPWKNKTDLTFFKNKTINQVIVMGSTTLLSLPNSAPLKNRINVVVTNNSDKYSKNYEKYNNILFVDKIQVLNLLQYCYKDKTIFIIGGNQIYDMLIPYCSTIWLTKIKSNYDCDLIFNYNIDNFIKTTIYDDSEIEIIRLE
jgi:dihydrofolate reductase